MIRYCIKGNIVIKFEYLYHCDQGLLMKGNNKATTPVSLEVTAWLPEGHMVNTHVTTRIVVIIGNIETREQTSMVTA